VFLDLLVTKLYPPQFFWGATHTSHVCWKMPFLDWIIFH
jgi:hypothetical protein